MQTVFHHEVDRRSLEIKTFVNLHHDEIKTSLGETLAKIDQLRAAPGGQDEMMTGITSIPASL
jgi:hypothetical protein